MTSIFAKIGEALRPAPEEPPAPARRRQKTSGNNLLTRLLGYVAGVCNAADGSGSQQADALLDGLQPGGVLTRRSYAKGKLSNLAKEALRFKEKQEEQNGHLAFWRVSFIHSKFGDLPRAELKARQMELRAALQEHRRHPEGISRSSGLQPDDLDCRPERSGAGEKQLCRQSRVYACERKRAKYARQRICEELDNEVWNWFVDRLATNKTRIWTSQIILVAQKYADTVKDDWRQRCDAGQADPRRPPKLPKIDAGWVRRWRYRFNVTYRTVNLRYKIPRKTFLSRLQVFWSNCIIMRKLFEMMFPGEKLEFIGFDQKPLWFNAISCEKTYAKKGAKKVSVAENVSASRARFTAFTQCRSWMTDTVPGIGVLFRIGDAACSLRNLRASLQQGANTLIQGAPKGSYRLNQVLEFLRWAVPPKDELGKLTCVVLDWFAPHLDHAVDDMIHGLGHCVLRIGGGLTPVVQVEDTHAHRPYNNHYRTLEKEASAASWELRPGSLLECSRQTVLTRAEDAWKMVDHAKCVRGWLHNGCTNALDGTQDAQLGSQVISYWEELGMDSIREQLLQDVTDAVNDGDVTSFWDYPDLLIDYDDHAPLREGMEGAPVYIYDESGAHVPSGMDVDDEGCSVDGDDATPLEAAMIQEEDDLDATPVEAAMPQEEQFEDIPADWMELGAPSGMQPGSPPNVSSAASSSSSPNLLSFGAEADVARQNFLDMFGAEPDAALGAPPLPPPLESHPDDVANGLKADANGLPVADGLVVADGLQPDGLQAEAHPEDVADGLQPDGSVNSIFAGLVGADGVGVRVVKSPATPPTTDDMPNAKRRRIVEAFGTAREALLTVGQHTIANYLEDQAQRLLRAEEKTHTAVGKIMAQVTMNRKRKIEEVRVEDKANRDRLQQMKIELQIATEQRLAASEISKQERAVAKAKGEQERSARLLASLTAKADAKAKEEKAKASKEEAKADMQKKVKEKEELRRTFAGTLAAAILSWMSPKATCDARRKALKDVMIGKIANGKIAWKKVGAAPEFWSATDKRGLSCISAKDNFHERKEIAIYASDDFSWEMWNHKKPDGSSLNQFRTFVEFIMPGYNKAIAPRYPLEELLKSSAGNADIAFLTAVWFYSSLVPEDLFPCGLRHWPPQGSGTAATSSGSPASASSASPSG
jgi:hypothetical protein